MKKKFLALLACIVLFAGAVGFTLVFHSGTGGDATSSTPIVISEILASNRTCPGPNGKFLDYIEIHNTMSSPVDISGYMLGVNPFNQPGVEAYKQNMFRLLGKPGYE